MSDPSCLCVMCWAALGGGTLFACCAERLFASAPVLLRENDRGNCYWSLFSRLPRWNNHQLCIVLTVEQSFKGCVQGCSRAYEYAPQMYGYNRRKKNKLNCSTMHRALCCTCSLKSPSFSLPSLLQILISFAM